MQFGGRRDQLAKVALAEHDPCIREHFDKQASVKLESGAQTAKKFSQMPSRLRIFEHELRSRRLLADQRLQVLLDESVNFGPILNSLALQGLGSRLRQFRGAVRLLVTGNDKLHELRAKGWLCTSVI